MLGWKLAYSSERQMGLHLLSLAVDGRWRDADWVEGGLAVAAEACWGVLRTAISGYFTYLLYSLRYATPIGDKKQ